MKTMLDVSNEINRMEQCIQKVDFCTKQLAILRAECEAKKQSNKLSMLMMAVTLYSIAMIGIRLIAQQLYTPIVYLGLTVVGAIIVYFVVVSFPTKQMQYLGIMSMLIVALASLMPVLPDLLYSSFESVSEVGKSIFRIIPLIAAALLWAISLLGNKERNDRLRAMWNALED